MDSSTKRTLIILGVIVVVLLMLFVVAVVAADGKSKPSGCTSDRREAWRERLLGSQSVKPGQLRGCTSSLGTFVMPGGSCVLVVAASDARSRQLKITLESALEMTLDINTDADGRTLSMHPKLKPHKSTQISFGKDEQRITFQCPALLNDSCRITLQ